MSGDFALQVVAGLVLAVNFAGLIETLRGTGFVEDLGQAWGRPERRP
jgi:hypothetical protein